MVTKRQARRRLWLLVGTASVLTVAVALGLSGGDTGTDEDRSASGWGPVVPQVTGDELIVATARTAPGAANVAARTLLTEAPVAVVAPAGDPEVAVEGSSLAEDLRSPLLFAAPVDRTDGADPFDLAGAAAELSTEVVVLVGGSRPPEGLAPDVTVIDRSDERVRLMVQDAAAAEGPSGGVVLVRPGDRAGQYAAPATLAAGHRLVPLSANDPRADREAAAGLRRLDRPVIAVVGSAGAWAGVDTAELRWQSGVARAGHQLPGGGQILYPYRILTALYGTPGEPALGVLGEQGVNESIARARAVADAHQPFSDVPVVPAFELIATVATRGPGDRGDYSRRVRRDLIEQWVEAAGEAGVYVVLDLQPGRSSFLAQAKELRDLLAQPHVGLALDSEWRLGPDEEPLEQIGSVAVEEVNAVSNWLADLTRNERLPQKLLLLHQFDLDMIRGRARLDTSRTEITTAIQMDGQGTQAAKLDTWTQLRTVDPPTGVWWGWKNFYDEDPVVRSPRDTLGLSPVPVFVSYQ